MSFQTGTATDYRDLLDKLRLFLTTDATLVAAGQAWVTQRWATTATTQELILKAPGLGGTDQIYVGFNSFQDTVADYFNWTINGYTGYDAGQTFFSQPGSIGANNTLLPCLNLWNGAIPYWFVANGRRCIIVARVNTRYFVAYVGLSTPYATTNQYPYPLCILANNSGNQATRWSAVTQGRYIWAMRGAAWNYPTLWPTNQIQILPTDDSVYTMLPIVMHSQVLNNGANRFEGNYYGELDGLFYVPGLNNVSENTIAVSAVNHLVVQNGALTGLNDYWAVKLA